MRNGPGRCDHDLDNEDTDLLAASVGDMSLQETVKFQEARDVVESEDGLSKDPISPSRHEQTPRKATELDSS